MVIALYILVMCVILPFFVWEMRDQGVKREVLFVGGLFTCLTLPLSLWGILQHLIHFTKPEFQRHIIRVLWMVPIYSVNAFLGMRFSKYSVYFDSLRECYEAYVIYNFMRYLLNYLYSEYELEDTLASKRQVPHLFPFCFCRPWTMGKELIVRCKHGALQYAVIRPVTTAIAFLCECAGLYGVGDFDPKKSFVYLLFANNVSQIYALYCLVLFYVATKEELMPIQPVGKFFSVKCIVFASFWQGMLITILVNAHVIPMDLWNFKSKADCSQGLQDFLICIEMFIAAVAHIYVFSHKPYITDTTRPNAPCCESFMSMWDVSDMRDDVYEHMRVVRGRLMEAGFPDARAPRYGWKDAKAGESSRLLSQTSLSNTSLNNGYISDNGPLNTNNNNNNVVLASSGEYASVPLGGYASSDSEGMAGRERRRSGGGGVGGGGVGGGGVVGGGVGGLVQRSPVAPKLPVPTSVELIAIGSDRNEGFHNPLEGVSEDERVTPSNAYPKMPSHSLLDTNDVTTPAKA